MQRFRSPSALGGLMIVLLVILMVAGLGFAEILIRRRERERETVPGTMPMIYYPHRRLRHALVRGADYFGWAHINSDGFRGRATSRDKPLGTTRIMVVGSSTTFDVAVTGDEHAWPARLEYWLQRAVPNQRFELINAGVPGYILLDDIIRLQTELYRFRPDILILYEGHNDLFNALAGSNDEQTSSMPDALPVSTPWRRWLSSHSLLFAKLASRARAVQFHAGGAQERASSTSDNPTLRIERGADGFERNLAAFLAIARNFEIPVVLPELVNVSGSGATQVGDPAVRRMWETAVPFAAPDIVLNAYDRFNEVIRNLAERFDSRFIATSDFGLLGPQWYADGDPIHFNDRGAERMARSMADALVASGIVSRVAASPR